MYRLENCGRAGRADSRPNILAILMAKNCKMLGQVGGVRNRKKSCHMLIDNFGLKCQFFVWDKLMCFKRELFIL